MNLSNYRLYRRRLGGVWYKVTPVNLHGGFVTWINSEPTSTDRVLETEDYTTNCGLVDFPEK